MSLYFISLSRGDPGFESISIVEHIELETLKRSLTPPMFENRNL